MHIVLIYIYIHIYIYIYIYIHTYILVIFTVCEECSFSVSVDSLEGCQCEYQRRALAFIWIFCIKLNIMQHPHKRRRCDITAGWKRMHLLLLLVKSLPKMKILSSFTDPHVISKLLWFFLSSVEHQKYIFPRTLKWAFWGLFLSRCEVQHQLEEVRFCHY